jgi:hypothetical protein
MPKRRCYTYDVSSATASGITRFVNSLEGLSPEDRRSAFYDLVLSLEREDVDQLSRIALAHR